MSAATVATPAPKIAAKPLLVRRAAVLGAGTMGSRIAAHLANAGVPCWLLDIVPSELTADEKARGLTLADPRVRNRIVRVGLEAAQKARPAAFPFQSGAFRKSDRVAVCGG